MTYKARYKQYFVTKNMVIRNSGFSCITFENVGTGDATLNDVIELRNGLSRSFTEMPYVQIESDFYVKFADPTVDNKILVVETYYIEKK